MLELASYANSMKRFTSTSPYSSIPKAYNGRENMNRGRAQYIMQVEQLDPSSQSTSSVPNYTPPVGTSTDKITAIIMYSEVLGSSTQSGNKLNSSVFEKTDSEELYSVSEFNHVFNGHIYFKSDY